MAISINEIGGLLARFGNEIVNEQSNMACPFVGNGHIQKVKHAHEQGVVRIREGDGLSSTGQLADGSALPEGSNVSFQSATYLPKIFFTRLSIPRGAAHLATGGRDGVRLVREELEVAGRQLGKVLGQAVFRAPYTNYVTPIATGAPPPNPPVDIDTAPNTIQTVGLIPPGAQDVLDGFVTSIAGLYIGQYVQVFNASTAQFESVKLLEINHTMDTIIPGGLPVGYVDPASVGFGVFQIVVEWTNTNAVPALLQVATSGLLNNELVAGPGDSRVMLLTRNNENQNPPPTLLDTDPMVSLGEAYDATPLYPAGLINGAYTGNKRAVNGPLSAKSMRDMSTVIKRRAGYGWHMLVMNSNNLQNYFETTIAPAAALNYLPGQTTKDSDGGATVPMFQGLPIVVDENVPDHVMYFFNKDDIKLAEFKDFGPDQDGTNAHGMVDRSKLIYDTQIWGMYNMRVQRRNSGGQLTGLQQNV